ncbi:MAG: ABC transporter permease [Ignavibacteriaceae bacterium]
MFKNYLKIAFRNLIKHKRYSLINILGLGIGLACFILIMLWVQDELSYDRFHKNSDNIYVVIRHDHEKSDAATSRLLASALKTALPEVVNAASFTPLPDPFKVYIKFQNKSFEENIAIAEPQFFDLFSFGFKLGNPQSAFKDPNSIIMTEGMSRKYFGEQNPVGKSVTLLMFGQERILKVTGILKNIPRNSHIRRELFVPIGLLKTYSINWDSWRSQTVYTYIQTQGKINISLLEKKILACKLHNYNEKSVNYTLLPLTSIHLYANNIVYFTTTGDIKYVYIFSIIAGIILLIACINYMNLSNALSLKRAKEIGIQKVIGAHRTQLMRQYFGETFILTILALGFGVLLVELLLPVLNQLSGKLLTMDFFNPQFILIILLTTVITCTISGLYPAVFISGFKPIRVLKGSFHIGQTGINLKKGLIVFQFALSVMIIVSTIIVLNQMNFIQNSSLGYDKENIVCLKVKSNISRQYEAFKNRLLENSNIIKVSRSEPLDANELGETEDVFWAGKNKKFKTWLLHVDPDFYSTYKIKMQEGRFYSKQSPADKTGAYVLNETAVEKMGINSPLGKELNIWGRKGKIIGIVKDFHFSSLHHSIEPIILRIPNPDEENIYYRNISVRMSGNTLTNSLSFIENTWKTVFPSESFNYYFVDEILNQNYNAEQRMSKIFKTFSLLAIFIACLGLYGLTAFTIEQKVKDIGIHKVLGASVTSIVFLISRNFLGWVIFSNAIAWPVAYFVMNKWLQNFAYRIDLTIWPFISAGLVALVIALLTVSWQAIRAATSNPVKSLRYE